jgi:integrase
VKVHNRDQRGKESRLNILKEHFKAAPLEALSLQAVSLFVAEKKKADVKNATINRYLSLLHHMAEWAVGQNILEENPIRRLEKLEEPEWIGERPDDSVIDAIFALIEPQVLPILVFLRDTGCRREEAITLRLSQVDFARQNVTFHTNTKNARSRQVPLTDDGLWAVSALPKHGPTVFYHPEYMEPWTGDGLAEYWQKARKAAGHPKLRIHDLRHAYGIKLAEEGCPMHYISEVMGHHSIDFTRKKYARFSPGSASKAVLRVLQGRKAARAAETR